jgi:hypothetical protein
MTAPEGLYATLSRLLIDRIRQTTTYNATSSVSKENSA